MKLHQCCRLVRSKNAGAFWLTFDIMFNDDATYQAVKRTDQLGPERIKQLYPEAGEHLKFFYCDAASAIKFSFPREHSSGSPYDHDVFGGQQYAPLMDVEITLPD